MQSQQRNAKYKKEPNENSRTENYNILNFKNLLCCLSCRMEMKGKRVGEFEETSIQIVQPKE